MNIAYEAYDASGKSVRGQVEAADADAAREQLARQGLYVVSVGAGGAGGASASSGDGGGGLWSLQGRSRRIAHLVDFSRHLSVLVATGTPVADALAALERQTADENWRAAVRKLRSDVEHGAPLSEAMGQQPRVFDAVSRSLVAAGEASGELPAMLRRLSVVARQNQVTANALVGAMMYPIILSGIAATVMCVMLFLVVPRFAEMFETLDTPLPPTTVVLVAMSEALRGYWWLITPGVLGGFFGLAWWLRSPRGRVAVDRAIVRSPVGGSLARSLSAARMARLLGALLEAKLPLLESLDLVRDSMTNRLFADLIAKAREEVSGGGSLAHTFARSDLITPTMAEAFRSGESTGKLADVLAGLAEHMDEDNAIAIRSITTLLEPVILIVMGLIVGFVAISMFLPLFDLTAATGGGG